MTRQAPFTQDFRQELEVHTLRLLRQRFLWFLGSVASIYGVALIITAVLFVLLAFGVSREVALSRLGTLRGGYFGLMSVLVLIGIDVGVFIWCAGQATLRRNDRAKLLVLTQQFFIFRGLSDLAAAFIMRSEGFMWYTVMYHILACALLPWTPMQALRPMLLLVGVNAALLLVSPKHGWGGDIAWILVSVALIGPGVAIATLKTGRRTEELKLRFLQDRYGKMRRELVDARRIHEALFPRPITDGPLRFMYKYEPMRQIGGDYLYARFSPPPADRGEGDGSFNLLLIDVTGHGIAAALTVNRLYGEVERLFAEDPWASPADVLAALNRYVHLTLSRHSVYATALCIRVDVERDIVEFASGGHPPAFLCAADGTIHEMESTAMVLGAIPPGEFDAGMQSLRFTPGDCVIAYTDGAIEARNPDGRMLGVLGIQQAIAACANGRCEMAARLLSFVEEHRGGPPEDDTLVVEIARTVGGVSVEEKLGPSAPAMHSAAAGGLHSGVG